MRSYEEDVRIEEAICFLVSSFQESGNNPKPVVLHSIKVGLCLYTFGHAVPVVIAGFLHDVLEDTAVSQDEIASRFGDRVADLVSANSFDSSIQDPKRRYEELFLRCRAAGKDALIVKCADFFDNAAYYALISDNDQLQLQREKLRYFVTYSKDVLHDDPLYQKLLLKCDFL